MIYVVVPLKQPHQRLYLLLFPLLNPSPLLLLHRQHLSINLTLHTLYHNTTIQQTHGVHKSYRIELTTTTQQITNTHASHTTIHNLNYFTAAIYFTIHQTSNNCSHSQTIERLHYTLIIHSRSPQITFQHNRSKILLLYNNKLSLTILNLNHFTNPIVTSNSHLNIVTTTIRLQNRN